MVKTPTGNATIYVLSDSWSSGTAPHNFTLFIESNFPSASALASTVTNNTKSPARESESHGNHSSVFTVFLLLCFVVSFLRLIAQRSSINQSNYTVHCAVWVYRVWNPTLQLEVRFCELFRMHFFFSLPSISENNGWNILLLFTCTWKQNRAIHCLRHKTILICFVFSLSFHFSSCMWKASRTWLAWLSSEKFSLPTSSFLFAGVTKYECWASIECESEWREVHIECMTSWWVKKWLLGDFEAAARRRSNDADIVLEGNKPNPYDNSSIQLLNSLCHWPRSEMAVWNATARRCRHREPTFLALSLIVPHYMIARNLFGKTICRKKRREEHWLIFISIFETRTHADRRNVHFAPKQEPKIRREGNIWSERRAHDDIYPYLGTSKFITRA